MKRLDFMNKRLCEKNGARIYINNVDVAMLEYYRAFAKKIKPLIRGSKNGELLFVSVGTDIVTYALYKYLK